MREVAACAGSAGWASVVVKGELNPQGREAKSGTFWKQESCKSNSAHGTTTLIPDKAEITLVIAERPNLGIRVAKLA